MEIILLLCAGAFSVLWEACAGLGELIHWGSSRGPPARASPREALARFARNGDHVAIALDHARARADAVKGLMAEGYTRPEANAILRHVEKLGKGKG